MKELKYAYYPGCVGKGACRELHDSTVAIAAVLGIELLELDEGACCGAGTFKESNPLLEDTINARNIALAEAHNLPLMTQCSTCQGVIGKVNETLQNNPQRRAEVNQILNTQGITYRGTIEVLHLLWVIIRDYGIDRLKSKIKRPLTGLKCASFYGCYLLRGQTLNRFDDPYHPQSLEEIFRAVGATPIYYDGRIQCCGFPLASYDTKTSFRMAGKHLTEALEMGADCLVTPCPLCHLNLDARQPEVGQVIDRKLSLPVLHLPQLIGLALGIDPQILGLSRHVVSTKKILDLVTNAG